MLATTIHESNTTHPTTKAERQPPTPNQGRNNPRFPQDAEAQKIWDGGDGLVVSKPNSVSDE